MKNYKKFVKFSVEFKTKKKISLISFVKKIIFYSKANHQIKTTKNIIKKKNYFNFLKVGCLKKKRVDFYFKYSGFNIDNGIKKYLKVAKNKQILY